MTNKVAIVTGAARGIVGILDPINVKIEDANFKGKKAIRVFGANAAIVAGQRDDETMATLKNTNFENGTIEIDVAGQTLPNAGQAGTKFQ